MLNRLFNPESIAIIGASNSEDKVGYKILKNIIDGGFRGRLHPVNPRGGEILGLEVSTGIETVPGPVDVAAIVIPAPLVPAAVEKCARCGVRYCVVITSGFSEAGNAGAEREMVRVARAAGMRILGPNILGYYSAAGSLNLTFGPSRVLSGGVAIISQSGALGIALMGKTVVDNLRLSAFFSIGNKADLGEADLLEHLAGDEQTRVVLLYMEGVKDGPELVRALRATSLRKPVIVVKSGGSSKGSRAAASHTGSLAGSDEIFSAVMRQCGVIRAETLSDALDWSFFLAGAPRPVGENALIVTNGGGIGVMATDAAEKYGVTLYDDQAELERVFRPLIPGFGSAGNPVDTTAGIDHEGYRQVLEAALENDNIHALVVLYCQAAMCDIDSLRGVISRCARKGRSVSKPLVFAPVGDRSVNRAVSFLRARDILVQEDPYRVVSCLGALYRYKGFREILAEPPGALPGLPGGAAEAVNGLVEGVAREGRNFFLAHEGTRLLEAAGIGRPASMVAADAAEAVNGAREIGFPVVMKVVSPDILHKSDAGGVLLGVKDPDAVRKGFEKIRGNCLAWDARARFEGVEVSEMLSGGREIIVGARRDESFGPVVMCGLGGIYVEVMKDVAFRAFPAGRQEIRRMIRELRAYHLLSGVRGEKPADIESLVDVVGLVGAVLLNCPGITDIEINPLLVYADGVRAVDARVLTGGAHGR